MEFKCSIVVHPKGNDYSEFCRRANSLGIWKIAKELKQVRFVCSRLQITPSRYFEGWKRNLNPFSAMGVHHHFLSRTPFEILQENLHNLWSHFFRSKPIRRNCRKFHIFSLGKTYIKKPSCAKSNNILLNIQ